MRPQSTVLLLYIYRLTYYTKPDVQLWCYNENTEAVNSNVDCVCYEASQYAKIKQHLHRTHSIENWLTVLSQ
jgi:hypothetical protein